MNFFDQWEELPENITYDNGFKIQWEDFIRHVVAGTPWKHDLVEGAKGGMFRLQFGNKAMTKDEVAALMGKLQQEKIVSLAVATP